jgi:sulfur relay (sulfurtransferase) complex TusBCD TusD component (DsrE family)
MRESTIEQAVCAYAKAKDCLTLKLSGQNQKGQPDRMFLYQGRVLFIEFKAPGKKPTALQARWLERLTEHTFHATSCDNIEAGKRLIDLITMTYQ